MAEDRPGKNIVICCDGTNNDPEHDETNVARLYQLLDKDNPKEQIVYYDPGVGTFAQPGLISPFAKNISMAFGLAFGAGFTHNLQQAYAFLIQNYVRGDRIFLFGFSRGAFTVRALAGLIHMCGILRPGHENLIPYATRIYKGAGFASADRLRRTYSWKLHDNEQPIRFLGLWDTVSSLGFFLDRRTLPYTNRNPSVRKVRHAMAINERRAYFRPDRWQSCDGEGYEQDLKEVWFPGVHSDIGGGYPRRPKEKSELAVIALAWMIQEAVPSFTPDTGYLPGQEPEELRIVETRFREVLLDRQPGSDGKYRFDPVEAHRHRSLQGAWWTLEGFPKNHEKNRWKFALPLAQKRQPVEGDSIHVSAVERAKLTSYKLHFDKEKLKLEDEDWPQWGGSKVDSSPQGRAQAEEVTKPSLPRMLTTLLTVTLSSYIFWSLALSLVNFWLTVGSIVSRLDQEWPLVWAPIQKAVLGAVLEAWTWPCVILGYLGVIEICTPSFEKPLSEMFLPLLLFLAPLVVILLGGWCINKLSDFDKVKYRIQETILHKRSSGFDAHNIANQFFQLRPLPKDKENPLDLYRRSLVVDRWFPPIYVIAFIVCLKFSEISPGFLLLPLFAGLADFLENRKLIQIIDGYKEILARFKENPPRHDRELVDALNEEHRSDITLASRATWVKIGLILMSLLVLAGQAVVPIQFAALFLLSILIILLAALGLQVFFQAFFQALFQGR